MQKEKRCVVVALVKLRWEITLIYCFNFFSCGRSNLDNIKEDEITML